MFTHEYFQEMLPNNISIYQMKIDEHVTFIVEQGHNKINTNLLQL